MTSRLRFPSPAARAKRAFVACVCLGLSISGLTHELTAEASSPPPAPPSATPAKRGGWSLKDSPGYYAIPDPESMSVVLGRRPNAPLVRTRFEGGERSLEALGRAVCRALENAATDSLARLCVAENEFREVLWPEFPQSRPATGLMWEDGWLILSARLRSGCRTAVADEGGRVLNFVRFESDTTARYRNFKLHNGLALVARNDRGEEERHTWLRSVAECKGMFKIYSVND
ncbi:MAG TPA: hypothetical protein VEY91_06855 [Candidatus Limnocylindria bacterium]|nr:hypothetical protein [Candidatus Limnocylindria bacterium]